MTDFSQEMLDRGGQPYVYRVDTDQQSGKQSVVKMTLGVACVHVLDHGEYKDMQTARRRSELADKISAAVKDSKPIDLDKTARDEILELLPKAGFPNTHLIASIYDKLTED